MLKSLAPKISCGAVGQLLENSYHTVASKDQVDEQIMPIKQTAQASIISQLTLEEIPQVD